MSLADFILIAECLGKNMSSTILHLDTIRTDVRHRADYGSGAFVGENARHYYHTYKLFRGAKHPPVKLAFYPGFQDLAVFLTSAALGAWVGPTIKRATGKPIFSQMRDMISLWYKQGIDPPSYYALEFYDENRSLGAPQYLTRFETKNGLLKSLNLRKKSPYAISEMNNKDLFATCCRAAGLPHPVTIARIDNGRFVLERPEQELQQDLFCKRINGMGATGTRQFKHVSPLHYRDENGEFTSLSQIAETLVGLSKKHPMVMQPWLKNHVEIADIALDSLLTFRVITVMNEQGLPETTLAMLRLLSKLEPQWSHLPDDEYAAPIDLTTGRLGRLTGDNLKTSHIRYSKHPVTGKQLHGRIVSQWPAIQSLAIEAHKAFTHRTLIGWDIALTPAGPVLLEGNTNFDVMFLQRVHDAPAAASRFGSLLNYHIQNVS